MREPSTNSTTPKRKRRQQDRGEDEWIWVFQEKLRMLAHDPAMKLQHWRVLAYLMSCVTFAEFTPIRQVHLSDELGIHRSNISNVLNDLLLLGIIKRRRTGKAGIEYSLNTEYVHKGSKYQLSRRRGR